MQKAFLRIGQNTATILLVNIFGSLIGFLMAAALGRNLGDAGFGQYTFVLTWFLSLTLFAEFGLSTVLTRDLAARPTQTTAYLTHSLVTKTLLSLPIVVGFLLFAPYIAPAQNPVVAAALRWGTLFFYSGLVYSSLTAVFKAYQMMTPLLWITVVGQTILFGGTLFLLLSDQSLAWIVAWAGISQSLQCGLAYLFFRRLRLTATTDLWRVDRALIKTLLVKAWPFALAGFLAAIQLRASVLLLSYLDGDQALGWYAAANRFVETGRQLPGAFYTAILPAMAAMAHDPGQFHTLKTTLNRAKVGLLLFGLAAVIGAWFLSQFVITLTYGTGYQPAVIILQVLALMLIPNGQNSLLVIYLYACNDEKFVNVLLAGGTVLNLGLSLWLIPRWGPLGTAAALLIAESVLYFGYRQRAAQRMKAVTQP